MNNSCDEFFTSEKAMARHFRARATSGRFRGETRAETRSWQKKARRRFSDLLGLQHFEPVAPRARKLESVEVDGLTRETWRIQTERDVWMPFYLFIPKGAKDQKLPLVLCPHGHGSSGKWATGGRSDIDGMASIIEDFRYDYGVQIARAGFITACSDARGFGERREPVQQDDSPDAFLTSSCHNLSVAGLGLGLTVQGMWTWDLMRLLDHLQNDARINAKHIGCAGLSGGGLQTLDLAALDERIKAAVVSGYFYGVRESLQIQNANCACNIVPGLWEQFDMGDIAAMIAPRALFIETGDADPLNGKSGLKNVRSQIEITRVAYEMSEASENLIHHVFEGEHRWDGERSIPWLREKLAR